MPPGPLTNVKITEAYARHVARDAYFWAWPMVNVYSRRLAFANVQLGKMHGTTPGFYLLVGPNWHGEAPRGITRVFRSPTNTGGVFPRVFQGDTPEDKQAIQAVLQQIMMYPLSEFDGTMKTRDWSKLAKAPSQSGGEQETKWVVPEKFVEELPAVLADAPPMPGEEARYAQVLAVLAAAKSDPVLKQAMTEAAAGAEEELVTPLLQFRNFGEQHPGNWSTISNGAAFGSDYFIRTAVAKSNIFVNSPDETKYFYLDLDAAGGRLNGANRYTVTFPKGGLPPVRGFWSLTLYNEHHFFAPNDVGRYSLGTKSKSMKPNPDGSLTIFVQADAPAEEHRDNWLPAPKGEDFSLFFRTYWPKVEVTDGSWTPPPADKIE
jgi:hypothetical protein